MRFRFSYIRYYAISRKLDLSHGVASPSSAYITSYVVQPHPLVTRLLVLLSYRYRSLYTVTYTFVIIYC